MIDPCDQLDPDGTHDCYAVNCSGTGTDRPEMTARGTDLFVTEGIQVSNPPPEWGPTPMTRAVWKSSNEGLTWTEWVPSPSARIVSEPPVEITTVGTHLVSLGRRSDQVTVTLWAQSKDDITVAPRETVLFSDLNTVDYGDNPSIIHSSLGIAQASSSVDGGDYVRIVYPVLLQPGSRQAARTGIVRVNADQTATIIPDSFVTVQSSTSTGSVVYPTLIEADRAAPIGDADERPPVVLYWVETSSTPDPGTSATCVHLPGCDWGEVSVKAVVFRGVNQSSTVIVDTAHSHRFKGNGDYVHGSSRYAVGGLDRFFLHWFNQNNAADNASVVRVPTARLLDVTR
jgi:hypothetical protein